MLIIAGAADVLSPISDLAEVFTAIRSQDKRLLVCGREQGFRLLPRQAPQAPVLPDHGARIPIRIVEVLERGVPS